MTPCNPQSFRTSGRTRPISKPNYGLPHHLELDLTRPIFPSTAQVAQSASGIGNPTRVSSGTFAWLPKTRNSPHWEQAYISNFLPETGDSNSARD
jgi:hypothetical protein